MPGKNELWNEVTRLRASRGITWNALARITGFPGLRPSVHKASVSRFCLDCVIAALDLNAHEERNLRNIWLNSRPRRPHKRLDGTLPPVLFNMRIKQAMTQKEVAELVDVCPLTISRAERGKATLKTQRRIAHALFEAGRE